VTDIAARAALRLAILIDVFLTVLYARAGVSTPRHGIVASSGPTARDFITALYAGESSMSIVGVSTQVCRRPPRCVFRFSALVAIGERRPFRARREAVPSPQSVTAESHI
jgi:hypothetical protein